jgi:hypothetical protein
MFDGAALRIVVVGQEYGAEDAPVSLKERYDSIIDCGVGRRFKREGMYKPLNPHMKGTTSVLRLLFGIPLGVDHESEYIRFEDGLQCHIFDAFALVNYLLCSAVKPGSTRGYSTTTMKQNCLPHFRQALEILEPTVIVVQGIGFWPWVRRAFDTVEPLDDVLHRVRVGSQEALLGAFSHPSAPSSYNWGRNERTPYLCDTVRPTVERIRQELFRN